MKLYVTAAIVSLLGLADAIYLTVQHVTGKSVHLHDRFGLLGSFEQFVRGRFRRAVGADWRRGLFFCFQSRDARRVWLSLRRRACCCRSCC